MSFLHEVNIIPLLLFIEIKFTKLKPVASAPKTKRPSVLTSFINEK